jgi:hypothetical protein
VGGDGGAFVVRTTVRGMAFSTVDPRLAYLHTILGHFPLNNLLALQEIQCIRFSLKAGSQYRPKYRQVAARTVLAVNTICDCDSEILVQSYQPVVDGRLGEICALYGASVMGNQIGRARVARQFAS